MTTDWTHGYRTDIDYTYGYYGELNPLRARIPLLNRGLSLPETFNSCELGFGQGISVNIHAAASTSAWYGTDFNPSQAASARDICSAAGSGAKLYDESFSDFCVRDDLPEFDFIGLHGIWTWISDENRAIIVEFIRKKLKLGGVLYISYNTLPGWAVFSSMRHIMREHAEVLGAEGRGILSRMNGAIDFAERLVAINPAFVRANPQVPERLKKMKEHNRHYVAHEYFNEHFYPMHFSSFSALLEPAKLQYACSAHPLDHIDALNLSAEQQQLLRDIPDPMFRESVRDFITNQQFRRDFWVKGARRLSGLDQAEALRRERVVLTADREDVSLKVTGSLGEANMSEAVYGPVLDALSDHKPKSLGQIEQALKGKEINFPQILQAAMVLSGAGHLSAAQDDGVIGKARKQTDRLNAHLCQKARGSGDISFLASPVTGGGIAVSRFQQIFIAAIAQGRKQPQEWAQMAWDLLAAQGQRIIKDGKTVDSPDDNLAELQSQAKAFAEKRLAVLKALQVV